MNNKTVLKAKEVRIFKLTQSLKQNINKGFVTSAVFLEVEKASDQV